MGSFWFGFPKEEAHRAARDRILRGVLFLQMGFGVYRQDCEGLPHLEAANKLRLHVLLATLSFQRTVL